jgi:hypothetical protein
MSDLRERRESAVHEHMDAENRLDVASARGAFALPRHEPILTQLGLAGAPAPA